MDHESTLERSVWHPVTLALLGGITLASVLFAHVAVVQTPGLDPPPETAGLFIVAATVGAVGYVLVARVSRLAYPVGALAGLVVLGVVGVVVSGVYGAAGPATNPVGPAVYVLLALALVVSSGMARRRGLEPGDTASASR